MVHKYRILVVTEGICHLNIGDWGLTDIVNVNFQRYLQKISLPILWKNVVIEDPDM